MNLVEPELELELEREASVRGRWISRVDDGMPTKRDKGTTERAEDES